MRKKAGVAAAHQREIADALLSKYPNAPTKTLARMAYRDNPSVWSNLEAARNYLRVCRGAHGEEKRKSRADKSHYRPLQQPGDPFGKIPTPHVNEWAAIEIHGPITALIINDPHIPFHDTKAVKCALGAAEAARVNLILLNGDIADHYAESFWVTDPRKRDFPQEVKDVRSFLGYLRARFPKARIIYKLGNHELRHIRYMMVKAPEVLGVPEFEFGSIYHLDELGIELVEDDQPIRLGKLNVLHGHEYRFAISNPVSAARGLYLRGVCHAMCGHFHQTSQHSKRSLNQDVISTWSVGCLCDLHPEYRRLNDWNHGFAMVKVDASDAFEVNNFRIINGKAYH